MGAAAKKRKTNVQKYHCTSCMTDRAASTFADYNPTETCEHMIHTCKACLKKWIETQLESTVFAGGVKCPECSEMMNRRDVEMAVTQKVFKRYDELERRWIADTTPGWRWCLNPSCRAGQVYEPPSSPPTKQQALHETDQKPAAPRRSWVSDIFGNRYSASLTFAQPSPTATPSAPDILTCNDCGARACGPCDRPWHEGETCEQYQARVKDRMEEEEASLKELLKHSKKCPQCERPIQKNGGCKHMHCTQCRVDFCWDCVSVIGAKGRYCLCYPQGPGH